MTEPANTRLNLPESTKQEMANLSRWAKYIAVSGFILGGITILLGVFTGLIALGLFHLGVDSAVLANLPSGIVILIYIAIVGAYFIPFLLLYNFSVKSKAAILLNSEKLLNNAINNLHQCFKFVGVITAMFIFLYVLIKVGTGIAFVMGLL